MVPKTGINFSKIQNFFSGKSGQNFLLFAAVFFAAVLFLQTRNANAAINTKVNYQGKLTDSGNAAVADGAYDIVFKLYTAAGGGAAIWTESWTAANLFADSGTDMTVDGCSSGVDKVAYTGETNESSLAAGQLLWNTDKKNSAVIESVSTASNYICVYSAPSDWLDGDGVTNRIYIKNGLFSVMLGGVSSLDSVNFNQTVYLGVTVGTDSEMIPRKTIGAVPAAFEARKLEGYTWAVPGSIGLTTPNAGAFTTLSSAYSGSSTAFTVNQSGAGWLADIQKSGASKFMIDNSGNVGIGTTAPGDVLEIQKDDSIYAKIHATNGSGQIAGIKLQRGAWLTDGYSDYSIYDLQGDLRIDYLDSNSTTNYLTLQDGTGNVGIGTTAPGAKFTVNESTLNSGPLLTWDSDAAAIIRNENAELAFGLASSSPYAYYMQARYSDSTARDILINPLGGNVGIGTTNPGYKLDVNGTFAAGASTFAGNILPSADNTYSLGSASYRWADLYLGPSSLKIYNNTGSNADYATLGFASNVATLNVTKDGSGIYRPFAINQNGSEIFRLTGGNSLVLGAGDGGTPQSFTLRGPAAAGTSIAGADMYFDASNGTDEGGSGKMIFRTAPAGSTPASGVIVGSTSYEEAVGNALSLTWSHTVAAGSNRLLVVEVSSLSDVSSITYGGVSLTELGSASRSSYVNFWYLKEPTVGTANVVVTLTGSNRMVAGATNYTNVDQTNTWGTVATANSVGDTVSVNVSSAEGELVIDALS